MVSNVTTTWSDDAWRRAAIPSLNAGLYAAATVMANRAVENMGTEGGGVIGADLSPLAGGPRLYRHNIRRKARYMASPPGRFPGVRTSLLRNSILAVAPERLGTPLHAAFGTGVLYGRWLEFGTSKMAARPWIFRSAMESRALAETAFAKVAGKALLAAGLVQGNG